MTLTIDDELVALCREIARRLRDDDIEAHDVFYSHAGRYCADYATGRQALTFSFSNDDGIDFWFELTPAGVAALASGGKADIPLYCVRPGRFRGEQ